MNPRYLISILAWATFAISSAVPETSSRLFSRSHHSVCRITHTRGADDSPAVIAALNAGCNVNSTIVFSAGVEYNVFTPIQFLDLQNVHIQIQGNLSFSQNISAIQDATTRLGPFDSTWLWFTGSNVTVDGGSQRDGGYINCHGQAWWNAVEQTNRPRLFGINVTGGTFQNIKVTQPIEYNFVVTGSNILLYNNYINAISNSDAFPFNTDAFDLSGSNIVVDHNTVYNGDDCMAIQNGAQNITFTNNYCAYNSHGASIGSLGKNGSAGFVSNVLVENCTFHNTLYAARFKAWSGGTGLVQNVTWRNLVLQNVTFPVFFTQNYYDQELSNGTNSNATTAVQLNNIYVENISGTINTVNPGDHSCVTDPCWYYVAGADGTQSVILDLFNSSASNIHFKDVNVRPDIHGVIETVICDPEGLKAGTKDIGFVCWDGAYIPTD